MSFSGFVILVAASLFLLWKQGRLGQEPAAEVGAPPASRVEPSEGQAFPLSAAVAHVDDGDTITLADGRQVRYLGIDAPERGEPFHEEARAQNRREVQGHAVTLRSGGPEMTDRYGRMLALVFVEGGEGSSGRSVNAALVRAGLASIYVTGPKAVTEAELAPLLDAQALAISERKGIWKQRLARARESQPLIATRFRIHRKDCPEVRSRQLPPIVSIEEELKRGKSFCRSCKPLE